MKHAVLMMVHKNPEHVQAFIDWLLKHKVSVVVHVDRNQSTLHATLTEQFAHQSMVCIISNPVSVNWSGVSQVKAEIALIEQAVQTFPDADYYHLISGECQPLFCPDEWDRFLDGKSYLESEELPEYEWRVRRFMPFGESPKNRTLPYRLASRMLREVQRIMPMRNNFGDEARLKGGNWFSLCRADVMTVRLHLNSAFVKRFRMTRCADEHFLQILFAQLGIHFHNYNLRYCVWHEGKASPEYLTIEQLSQARESGRYLFARKVDDTVFKEYSRKRLQ
ncbi:beta-1,6-N-acetylglucosaminyltransferase [Kushneria sp. TE3]|uniref:beta-1,6-N-acetylglucosaminyltransferase n=1 Tax=Kushneria sp. TE3 TaxID=3449832 RepID=UPI003F6864D8